MGIEHVDPRDGGDLLLATAETGAMRLARQTAHFRSVPMGELGTEMGGGRDYSRVAAIPEQGA